MSESSKNLPKDNESSASALNQQPTSFTQRELLEYEHAKFVQGPGKATPGVIALGGGEKKFKMLDNIYDWTTNQPDTLTLIKTFEGVRESFASANAPQEISVIQLQHLLLFSTDVVLIAEKSPEADLIPEATFKPLQAGPAPLRVEAKTNQAILSVLPTITYAPDGFTPIDHTTIIDTINLTIDRQAYTVEAPQVTVMPASHPAYDVVNTLAELVIKQNANPTSGTLLSTFNKAARNNVTESAEVLKLLNTMLFQSQSLGMIDSMSFSYIIENLYYLLEFDRIQFLQIVPQHFSNTSFTPDVAALLPVPIFYDTYNQSYKISYFSLDSIASGGVEDRNLLVLGKSYARAPATTVLYFPEFDGDSQELLSLVIKSVTKRAAFVFLDPAAFTPAVLDGQFNVLFFRVYAARWLALSLLFIAQYPPGRLLYQNECDEFADFVETRDPALIAFHLIALNREIPVVTTQRGYNDQGTTTALPVFNPQTITPFMSRMLTWHYQTINLDRTSFPQLPDFELIINSHDLAFVANPDFTMCTDRRRKLEIFVVLPPKVLPDGPIASRGGNWDVEISQRQAAALLFIDTALQVEHMWRTFIPFVPRHDLHRLDQLSLEITYTQQFNVVSEDNRESFMSGMYPTSPSNVNWRLIQTPLIPLSLLAIVLHAHKFLKTTNTDQSDSTFPNYTVYIDPVRYRRHLERRAMFAYLRQSLAYFYEIANFTQWVAVETFHKNFATKAIEHYNMPSPIQPTIHRFVNKSDPFNNISRTYDLDRADIVSKQMILPDIRLVHPSIQSMNIKKFGILNSRSPLYKQFNSGQRRWYVQQNFGVTEKDDKKTVVQFNNHYLSQYIHMYTSVPPRRIVQQLLYHTKDITRNMGINLYNRNATYEYAANPPITTAHLSLPTPLFMLLTTNEYTSRLVLHSQEQDSIPTLYIPVATAHAIGLQLDPHEANEFSLFVKTFRTDFVVDLGGIVLESMFDTCAQRSLISAVQLVEQLVSYLPSDSSEYCRFFTLIFQKLGFQVNEFLDSVFVDGRKVETFFEVTRGELNAIIADVPSTVWTRSSRKPQISPFIVRQEDMPLSLNAYQKFASYQTSRQFLIDVVESIQPDVP